MRVSLALAAAGLGLVVVGDDDHVEVVGARKAAQARHEADEGLGAGGSELVVQLFQLTSRGVVVHGHDTDLAVAGHEDARLLVAGEVIQVQREDAGALLLVERAHIRGVDGPLAHGQRQPRQLGGHHLAQRLGTLVGVPVHRGELRGAQRVQDVVGAVEDDGRISGHLPEGVVHGGGGHVEGAARLEVAQKHAAAEHDEQREHEQGDFFAGTLLHGENYTEAPPRRRDGARGSIFPHREATLVAG